MIHIFKDLFAINPKIFCKKNKLFKQHEHDVAILPDALSGPSKSCQTYEPHSLKKEQVLLFLSDSLDQHTNVLPKISELIRPNDMCIWVVKNSWQKVLLCPRRPAILRSLWTHQSYAPTQWGCRSWPKLALLLEGVPEDMIPQVLFPTAQSRLKIKVWPDRIEL